MFNQDALEAYAWCYAASRGSFQVRCLDVPHLGLTILRWRVVDPIDHEHHGCSVEIFTAKGAWEGRVAYLEGRLEAFVLDARRYVELMFPNQAMKMAYCDEIEKHHAEHVDVKRLRMTPLTCDRCPRAGKCEYAFDSYNTGGDCLAEK